MLLNKKGYLSRYVDDPKTLGDETSILAGKVTEFLTSRLLPRIIGGRGCAFLRWVVTEEVSKPR